MFACKTSLRYPPRVQHTGISFSIPLRRVYTSKNMIFTGNDGSGNRVVLVNRTEESVIHNIPLWSHIIF